MQCIYYIEIRPDYLGYSIPERIEFFKLEVKAAERIGINVGLLTSRDDWIEAMGNTDEFKHLPLVNCFEMC